MLNLVPNAGRIRFGGLYPFIPARTSKSHDSHLRCPSAMQLSQIHAKLIYIEPGAMAHRTRKEYSIDTVSLKRIIKRRGTKTSKYLLVPTANRCAEDLREKKKLSLPVEVRLESNDFNQ
jgi:hypothetical protein